MSARTRASALPWRATATVATAAALSLSACSADAPVETGVEVTAAEDSPTGFEATFRFEAPEAEQVWLGGDVYFTRPDLIEIQGSQSSWLGDEWQPGDVSHTPLAADLAPLTQGDDGVWEITMAVPAGMWSYGFITEPCSLIYLCSMTADPTNPAPLEPTSITYSAPLSQLFVPTDSSHPTYDADTQIPLDAASQGTVEMHTYDSTVSVSPAGSHSLGVYLPPDWDATRSEPYPLLVLSHGAGGDAASWFNDGGAATQFDHAIASGAMEPFVAVTTDFNGLSEQGMTDPEFFDLYATELLDNVLPYVENTFHTTSDPDRRAFVGLSMGGRVSEHLLHTQPGLFAEYGIWSVPLAVQHTAAADLTDAALTAAATPQRIHLGSGTEDALAPDDDVFTDWAAAYSAHGTDASTFMIHGGHTWWVWRQMLADFLAGSAFTQ
ncbi:alpha/beta hydrolase-fold protein [Demequina sp. B12]|uniref:alpha/beta hydrolase-fold protein n=1 Tax=Demequina sp. B12 TaxID=2992757 RepID=UPI00237B428B|nr:alpha/beta hydrolase-fold protein [Demequina sp. B12]MDE0573601.1 alpha/beta hydrolase-fold protein [Demequina sp. B12]